MAMPIKSYSEQDDYLKENPHECDPLTKGKWTVIGQKLTSTGIDRLRVRCSQCGLETFFEFDVISMIVPEISERMRALRDS